MKTKHMQVTAPRCSWGRRIGTVVGLVGLLATVQVQAQFSGDFAPSKWGLENLGNPGTYEWLGVSGDTATGLLMTGSTVLGSSDFGVVMKVPGLSGSADLTVGWTLTANGNVGNPTASLVIINGVNETVADLPTIAGSTAISLVPGDRLGFELTSDLSSDNKVPASLLLTLRQNPVPDSALNGLALLPMLGLVIFHAYRRSRCIVSLSTVGRS